MKVKQREAGQLRTALAGLGGCAGGSVGRPVGRGQRGAFSMLKAVPSVGPAAVPWSAAF